MGSNEIRNQVKSHITWFDRVWEKEIGRVYGAAVLGGCAANVPSLSPEAAASFSTQLTEASNGRVCATVSAPQSTEQVRQMAEAELAIRGVKQCSGRNIGSQTAARVGATRFSRGSTTNVTPSVDYDCGDFGSGAAAHRFFLASGGPSFDPHNLDGDGDGLACEWGTEVRRLASYSPPRRAVRPTASRRCYTGPRGGTYTITSGGNKNYSGC